jgi:hypothetical protein
MLLEELIEKAFSDGYEYALEEQREFASIRQATKFAKRTAMDAIKNNGLPEKVGRRSTQLQRMGYKLPTEKALDRISSVTTNTVAKQAKKHNMSLPFDKEYMKELSKKNARETAQRFHDLSTQRGFRTRKISEI